MPYLRFCTTSAQTPAALETHLSFALGYKTWATLGDCKDPSQHPSSAVLKVVYKGIFCFMRAKPVQRGGMPCSRSFSIPATEQGQNSGYLWSRPLYFPPDTMPEENGYCKSAAKFCTTVISSGRLTSPPQTPPPAQSHKFIHWIWMKTSPLLTGMTCVNL